MGLKIPEKPESQRKRKKYQTYEKSKGIKLIPSMFKSSMYHPSTALCMSIPHVSSILFMCKCCKCYLDFKLLRIDGYTHTHENFLNRIKHY